MTNIMLALAIMSAAGWIEWERRYEDRKGERMNDKKKIHCTNRNHLMAFNYAIEPDIEMIDECQYEEIPAPPTQEHVDTLPCEPGSTRS